MNRKVCSYANRALEILSGTLNSTALSRGSPFDGLGSIAIHFFALFIVYPTLHINKQRVHKAMYTKTFKSLCIGQVPDATGEADTRGKQTRPGQGLLIFSKLFVR